MRLSLNIFHGLILFVRCEICPNVKSGVLHPTMYIALQSCSALLIIIVMYTYCLYILYVHYAGSSPLQLTGLSSGARRLRIVPQGCSINVGSTFRFKV